MIINSNELYQLQQLCDSKHKIEISRRANGDADLETAPPGNRWAVELIYEWRARHPPSCEECKWLSGASRNSSGSLAGGLG